MTTFTELVDMVLKQEGVGMEGNPSGLVEIPGDPGGLTNWGISQRIYRTLRLGHEYHVYQSYPISVKDLTKEQALVIYEQEYWNKIPMKEDLPLGVALVLFDSIVNQGPGTMVKALQMAVGVESDGVVGPKTLGAVKLALRNIPHLIEQILWARAGQYAALGRQSEVFAGFVSKLWLPRLLKVRKEALRLRV